MGFFCSIVSEHLNQTRLSDSAFATQDDLSLTVFDLVPAFQEYPDFLLSTHSWRQSSCRDDIQAALDSNFLQEPDTCERAFRHP